MLVYNYMSDKTKQLFLWHGENDYEIFQRMVYWREVFEKKYTGLNIFSFDLLASGSKDKINNDLKNALQVNSLFGMNKLVILKNFLQTGSKLDKEVQELVLGALKKPAEGFFVVFYQTEKPDARNKIYKQIQGLHKKAIAEIEEFQLPKQNNLVKWILNKAKQYEINLSLEAVNLLAAIIGNDLWQLDREIHKLANYKSGEKVTTEDINLMVKGKYNDDIFQLMDAISSKNKKKALKLFQDQLDSGSNEIYLLTMLVRQFRIFWQIKEATEKDNLPEAMIAKQLKIHPYVVKKSLSQLRNFPIEQIKKIYQQLLDFEIKIKSTNITFELLFDLLIAEL